MDVPAPFYNAIKGTTSGTPGTGAFTPNAAATGFRAWSNVPKWTGLVRFEDGSAWELSYCYWDGTALSRGTNQLFDSSTGSVLTLTSSATAAMIVDGLEVMSHLGGTPWGGWFAQAGLAASSPVGLPSVSNTGTSAAANIGSGYRGSQKRTQLSSPTTANAQCGWTTNVQQVLYSTTAGVGGWEMVTRWGWTQLPTGPRWFVGMTSVTFVSSTSEPGSLVASLAGFGKDSTDTNIQLITNDNSGGGNKTDTGIPPSAASDAWFEATTWVEPGGGKVWGLLIRLDTGAIWLGSTTTQLPANNSTLFPQAIGGLSGTTGTAMIVHMGSLMFRQNS